MIILFTPKTLTLGLNMTPHAAPLIQKFLYTEYVYIHNILRALIIGCKIYNTDAMNIATIYKAFLTTNIAQKTL